MDDELRYFQHTWEIMRDVFTVTLSHWLFKYDLCLSVEHHHSMSQSQQDKRDVVKMDEWQEYKEKRQQCRQRELIPICTHTHTHTSKNGGEEKLLQQMAVNPPWWLLESQDLGISSLVPAQVLIHQIGCMSISIYRQFRAFNLSPGAYNSAHVVHIHCFLTVSLTPCP